MKNGWIVYLELNFRARINSQRVLSCTLGKIPQLFANPGIWIWMTAPGPASNWAGNALLSKQHQGCYPCHQCHGIFTDQQQEAMTHIFSVSRCRSLHKGVVDAHLWRLQIPKWCSWSPCPGASLRDTPPQTHLFSRAAPASSLVLPNYRLMPSPTPSCCVVISGFTPEPRIPAQ